MHQDKHSRRTYLKISALAAVPTALGLGGVSAATANDGSQSAPSTDSPLTTTCTKSFTSTWAPTPEATLLAGTKYETGVYVRDSGVEGPTAVIVAGQHGTERSAQDAAMMFTRVTPEQGKLVVIPHADMTAINGHTYSGDGGNLNRDWPSGQQPTSDIARAIWDELTSHAPDLAFDLHSSQGIYNSSLKDGVGQAIFPTEKGHDAVTSVINGLNEFYIGPSSHSDEYYFRRGNTQTGENPLLSHKYGGDLDIPAWLIETTRYQTTLVERTTWHLAAVTGCLAYHGMTFDLD